MDSVVLFLHIPKKKSSREEERIKENDQNQQTQENPNDIQHIRWNY